jgi:hypothetical protein
MKRKSHRHPSDSQWNDGPGRGRSSVETRERKTPKNWFIMTTTEDVAAHDADDADLDPLAWGLDDLDDER